MPINEVVGHGLVVIGLVFVGLGLLGLYTYKNFYLRLLITSKIDTVGGLTIILGIAVSSGWGFFSAKLLLLGLVGLILSPVVSHAIARTAYTSEHDINKTDIGAGAGTVSRPIDTSLE